MNMQPRILVYCIVLHMHVHAYNKMCDKHHNTGLHSRLGCIQPESFDQETIRGAPRAAATVVTGMGTGYYLSISAYIRNFAQSSQLGLHSGVGQEVFFRFVQHNYIRKRILS